MLFIYRPSQFTAQISSVYVQWHGQHDATAQPACPYSRLYIRHIYTHGYMKKTLDRKQQVIYYMQVLWQYKDSKQGKFGCTCIQCTLLDHFQEILLDTIPIHNLVVGVCHFKWYPGTKGQEVCSFPVAMLLLISASIHNQLTGGKWGRHGLGGVAEFLYTTRPTGSLWDVQVAGKKSGEVNT